MRNLLDDVNAFLQAYPQAYPSQIGKGALKDSTFVAQLKKGRKVRKKTEDKVRAWIAEFAAKEARETSSRRRARRKIDEIAAVADGQDRVG